jgi:hypothetical protein
MLVGVFDLDPNDVTGLEAARIAEVNFTVDLGSVRF